MKRGVFKEMIATASQLQWLPGKFVPQAQVFNALMAVDRRKASALLLLYQNQNQKDTTV